MIATTNTNVSTGQNAKQKEIPSAEKIDMRDYFAAKAMHASLSLDPANAASSGEHARWAYEMADAMLRVRQSK